MPCLRSRSPCLELETSLYSNIDFRNTLFTGETFLKSPKTLKEAWAKKARQKAAVMDTEQPLLLHDDLYNITKCSTLHVNGLKPYVLPCKTKGQTPGKQCTPGKVGNFSARENSWRG